MSGLGGQGSSVKSWLVKEVYVCLAWESEGETQGCGRV